MNIKDTAISAKVVIESLICLLQNESVDVSSIKFKISGENQGTECPSVEFEKLIDLAVKGLDSLTNSLSHGEFILLNKECSDEMAEVIARVARVCGGGADDIYNAIVKQAMVEVITAEE